MPDISKTEMTPELSTQATPDAEPQAEGVSTPAPEAPPQQQEASPEEKALVKELTDWCTKTRDFWKPVHDAIDDELKFVGGYQWPDQKKNDDRYIANVVRRLVNQKVAATYAKNPKTVSRARPKLDFVIWDGEQASLEAARMASSPQVGQMAQADPNSPAAQAFAQAHAILADYQNGESHKQMVKKWGKTLEMVYDFQCDQQQPGTFKSKMKALVRRALSARVGWVKLGYRRQGETMNTTSLQANTPELMKSIAQRLNEVSEGNAEEYEACKMEVQSMLQSLQQGMATGAVKVVDEGLVFDFPKTKEILVDKDCTNLKTFSGCRRIAQEFKITPEEVERRYGVEVEGSCTPYNNDGPQNKPNSGGYDRTWPEEAKCCVWEIYDIETQQRYTICDGYEAFLEEPTTPEPAISRFWPIFALTFNDLEVDENKPELDLTCYAPSDVRLLMPMQRELNRSREALRDHRIQNRPAYVADPRLTESDRKLLASGYASGTCFTLEKPLSPGEKASDFLAPVPKIPLDPAVYQTQHIDNDILLTVGAQQANLGPTTGATATETSVAEGSRIQSGSSDIDDLDELLTDLARAGGEMLLAAMQLDTVKRIVGPGAAWPTLPSDAHNSELFLESEASGSGRPNKAMEVSNFQQLAPLLMQIPGINPEALAREGIKRLDDRLELDEMFNKDLPSIMAMNAGPGPVQQGADMAQEEGQPGAQETQPGMTPPTANQASVQQAQQSPTTQTMPPQFRNKTAAAAAQPPSQ